MALDSGDVTTAIRTLDTPFRFMDHGLGLEFTETPRLGEFWHAVRKVLFDTKLEIVHIVESADCTFAEWRLTGTAEDLGRCCITGRRQPEASIFASPWRRSHHAFPTPRRKVITQAVHVGMQYTALQNQTGELAFSNDLD